MVKLNLNFIVAKYKTIYYTYSASYMPYTFYKKTCYVISTKVEINNSWIFLFKTIGIFAMGKTGLNP